MQGVYLKFFVHESERHAGRLLYEWLLEEAQRVGVPGGSAFRAVAGYGRHGVIHEQHFFELAGGLAIEIVFALSEQEADRLLAHFKALRLSLFYVRVPAEFGRLDG
jgi:PII-like signaling protein